MSTSLPEMALSFGFSRKRRRETPRVATETEPDPRQVMFNARKAQAAEALVPFIDSLLLVGAPTEAMIGSRNYRLDWSRKLSSLVLNQSRLVQGEEELLIQPVTLPSSRRELSHMGSIVSDDLTLFHPDQQARDLDEVKLEVNPRQTSIDRATVAIQGITAALSDVSDGRILAITEQRVVDDISILGDVHGRSIRSEGAVSGLMLRGVCQAVPRWTMLSVQ